MKTSVFSKLTALLACAGALVALPLARANNGGAEAKFKAMDTDGDGRVSRAEHAAGARAMFEAMDTNHDGVVTADEMTAYKNSKGEANRASEMSSSDKIKAVDEDGDGKLTAAEHEAKSTDMFTKMDTDGDGYLSLSEMTAGHEMMKKQK